ncbi:MULTISPECIES: 16S rRNA (adenine(1518)-N(6)/adenine(1519)-N(6))-dimethyltransferase RsmA [Microvirgula]|uniref:Ribosomal RNA small subunit methyltransferase A n=1 Tax=Microvirgula aerodenitrificans TaxID=57480 RepID=A0A2S0P8W1_9NEIS|nr:MULTISPECIES: 16S rRNA (adenine(1518)-N(6)/adenine(1519)-N(6))-dimethyltransferase RsmA [Microvirgula]AVY93727.1 16S rRNA (adenine(1518)-N(6)/adenine(1519)-N(6))-dimethyltransferase RsmA [Microvirgula aerodenitrificans]RAS20282.1 dimethyladenosine transferase [Microvirgula sp. AG722]
MSRHIPKKRFGQNFLQDPIIIDDIVSAVAARRDDTVVEIGPGLGALTRPLLDRLDHLHVVEIDRDIIARLRRQFQPERLTIHEGDALEFDFGTLVAGKPFKVVGNLPYNISTPLLFHLADYAESVVDMHFMLQKEVVDRMVAEPATADYGRLGVMLQYRFDMERILDVPPEAFDPPPKVDSAVIRMVPHAALPHPARDTAVFAELVASAFGQRRKTLRNNLRGLLGDEDFAALSIDPQRRPETLTLAEFVALADRVAVQRIESGQ